ncbi:Flp pilus assembly protein CpaB [Vibrionales bacterium C3R12]|nr:Flp pilus assembly protein CpaB [Vibrionales bacterium C3R12]
MKNKIIIIIAAVAILIGLFGLAGSLSAPETDTVQAEVVPEIKIKIWRLRHDVELGQKVQRNDFSIELIPESEAHTHGISEDIELNFEVGSVYNSARKAHSITDQNWIVQPNDDGYVELIIQPQRVPYAISVDPKSVVGGVITNGTVVDILALSIPGSVASVEVGAAQSARTRTISITPILIAVKVLQVKKTVVEATHNAVTQTEVDLILELTRKQVAKLTVAKRISELEVHKSIGKYKASDLQADAGDVLADFKSITEFRASEAQIK